VQRILVVDPGHGARSQMAEALLRQAAGDRYEIGSAGTEPVGSMEGVEAILLEVGVDAFVPTRRAITSALHPPPDLLVTVCEEGCGSCPYVPGARRVERWPQPDPDLAPPGERMDVLRAIRDSLRLHVATLVRRSSM
jgi:arsenate reductase